MTETLAQMFVDGAWAGALSGETRTATSPATGEAIGEIPEGGREDAQRAIAAANAAAPAWARLTAFERAAAMTRIADVIDRRRDSLARTLTLDQGKPLHAEAYGEVEELIAYWRNAAEDGIRLEGRLPNSVSPGKRVLLVRRPLGVVGVITPWNWPYTMPAELIAPALACGNTVVWTPAPSTVGGGDRAGRVCGRGRSAARGLQPRDRAGLGRRRRDRAERGDARDRLHRLDRDRAEGGRGRGGQAAPARARRQRAARGDGRRRCRALPPRRRSPRASCAPARAAPPASGCSCTRACQGRVRRAPGRVGRRARGARRPVRRPHDARPAEQRARSRRRWTSMSPTPSPAAPRSLPAARATNGFPTDALLAGDDPRRCPGRLARRSRGDVRADRADRADRVARRGDRACERVAVRPARGDLHARPALRACGSPTRCGPAG